MHAAEAGSAPGSSVGAASSLGKRPRRRGAAPSREELQAAAVADDDDALSDGVPHPEQAQSEYSFPSPHASVHARDEDSDDDEAADGGLGRRDDDDELLNALPRRVAQAGEDGEEDDEVEGEDGEDGDAADGSSGSSASAATQRPKVLARSSLKAVRFAEKSAFVLLTTRSTGGKAARLVALAARYVEWDGTEGPEDFKEYIKTARTPTKADAVQLIDGISMATVQERAKATFKTVGQNFLWWLQRCTADYDGPVIFVTWDAKGATQTLELLSCEMRRAALSLLNLGDGVAPLVLELGHALAVAGVYSKIGADKWPERNAKNGGAQLSLQAASTYIRSQREERRANLGARRGRAERAEQRMDSPVDVHAMLSTELDALRLVINHDQGVRVKAGHKALAWSFESFWQWAGRVVAFEARQLLDPPPGSWSKPEGWPRGGPTSGHGWTEVKAGDDLPVEQPDGPEFCPHDDASGEGGPSTKLKRHLGIGRHARTIQLTSDELMLKLFTYYFDATVMQLIVDSTNAHAQGVAGWRALSIGELYVFLGFRFVMGVHWRPQIGDYWNSTHPGMRVPLIAETMLEDRYKIILAHLSFMVVGGPSDPGSGHKLRKMFTVDDLLIARAASAWDAEPEATVDEHRNPLASRYCKLVTTMMCKPIKVGVNNYLLTYQSGYTARWRWFTGAGSRTAQPQGQPTDTAPLNEDNEEELGYIIALILYLLENHEGTGITIYLDKAFASVKLARLLALKGIAMVGMTRSTRPKTDAKKPSPKLPPEHYFPFRKNEKAEADELERWTFRRSAFTQLPDRDGKQWWLNAEVWLDKSFVTMLNTGWFSKEGWKVPRWSDESGKKLPRDCSLGLYKYSKGMGAVDRVNKEVALARMNLGRCPKRYQRQLFLGTDLPVVGLVNVRVAFGKLWPDVEQLQSDAGVFGYKRWFQLQLGENIIRHGIDWCKEQPDETFLSAFLDDEVDEEEDGPHFMPRRLRRVGPSTPAVRVPKRCSVEHELVNTYLHPIPQYEGKKRVEDWTRKRACAMCEVRSRREGGGTVQEGGEGQRKRRADPESGGRVKQTWWACNRCKVNLCCEACFDQWDHERGRPPCSSATVD